MKRKSAAMVLSLTLCAAMVGETGASSMVMADDLLTAGEITASEETSEEAPLITEPETDTPEEEPDSLLLPDVQTPQNDTLPEVEDELTSGDESSEIAEEPAEASEITPETAEMPQVAEDPYFAEDGTLVVHANSWVKVEQGFKLVKPLPLTVSESGENTEDIPVVDAAETAEELPEALAADLTEEPESTEASSEEPAAPIAVQFDEMTDVTAGAPDPVAVSKKAAYVTADDGLMKVTTVTVKGTHTGYYAFDENGLMITSRLPVRPGAYGYAGSENTEMFFANAETAELYSEYAKEVAKTPVTSTLGQRQSDYWFYDTDRFVYYDPEGLRVPTAKLLEQAGGTGILKINGKYYSLKSSGAPRTGLTYLTDKTTGKKSAYYFEETGSIPGAMVMGCWKNFNINGRKKFLYFQPESAGANMGKAEEHTGYFISKVGTKSWYLLDRQGYIQKNKLAKAETGKTYGTDSAGRIYMDKIAKFGNYRYYFTKTGYLSTYKNRWAKIASAGDRYYYFGGSQGRIVEKKGIQRVTYTSGSFLGWFYFNNNGNQVKNQFVGYKYFGEDGKIASGRTTVRGKEYFFEPSDSQTCRGDKYRSTLLKSGNTWYYAQGNGVLFERGWISIKGKWYFFNEYHPQTDRFRWHGSTYGYLNASGVFCTGWVVVSSPDNKVRYVDPNGNKFYKNTSVVIDGLRYHFDNRAYRINDVSNIYTGGYYVEVDRVNGVATVYTADRSTPVKSMRVSVGAAGTETPTGVYSLSAAGRWQLLMGPSYGQYGTHVNGAGQGGIFVHSIPCSTPSIYGVPAVPYSILGHPASHGCIRMCVADAKFIYERCNGATIRIFDGTYYPSDARKGPLGKPALVPMTGNFDPTDPLA